jgi:hypothetical protein
MASDTVPAFRSVPNLVSVPELNTVPDLAFELGRQRSIACWFPLLTSLFGIFADRRVFVKTRGFTA